MAEKCTKTSSPVERWINPYPFAPLNHFTVPFSLTKNSFRLIAKNDSSAFCFALAESPRDTGQRCQSTPSKDGKNFGLHRRTRVGHCSNRRCSNRKSSSAFRRMVIRGGILRSCTDEGALSHC